MSRGAEDERADARAADAVSKADAISQCPRCGTKMPASRASDRCPVCQLRGALDAETEVEPGGDLAGEGASGTELLAGRFDHYELLMSESGKPIELGRGAMGVTYKAIDTNLHSPLPGSGIPMSLRCSISERRVGTIFTRWNS
jgi:hypothetical protein